jgi:hypothetical protein
MYEHHAPMKMMRRKRRRIKRERGRRREKELDRKAVNGEREGE